MVPASSVSVGGVSGACDLVGDPRVAIKPKRREDKDQEASHRQILDDRQSCARPRRGLREYEGVAHEDEGDHADHHLNPESGPSQTLEGSSQAFARQCTRLRERGLDPILEHIQHIDSILNRGWLSKNPRAGGCLQIASSIVMGVSSGLERDRSASGLSKTPGLAREKDSRAVTWSQVARVRRTRRTRFDRAVETAPGPSDRQARVAGAADAPRHAARAWPRTSARQHGTWTRPDRPSSPMKIDGNVRTQTRASVMRRQGRGRSMPMVWRPLGSLAGQRATAYAG